ncbi:MAG: O-methyltransferase [Chitinophagales bacterium]|nr:MAG: O-methyltransferase [Chitinophagales bacterium]
MHTELMVLIEERILQYCESCTKPASALLRELERETHLKTLYPQMLSGPIQGKFLSLLSSMLRPNAILELGTFTGYSAICLAEGLSIGGVLHTIESNEELEPLIRKYITQAGLTDKVILHIGTAEEVVPSLDLVFDLVFIDADKPAYPAYYDLVFDKVRTGGFILADNALWSGKVLDANQDRETSGIHAFNLKVKNDPRVDNVLLPVRDGLMLIRKCV